MKLCAACHQDLPKDKFSKKQWKLGAQSQRRCTSCVADNREAVQPPLNNNNEESANNNGSNEVVEIVSSFESISMNDNEMIPPSDEDLFKQTATKKGGLSNLFSNDAITLYGSQIQCMLWKGCMQWMHLCSQ